jgi:hypothetical protein
VNRVLATILPPPSPPERRPFAPPLGARIPPSISSSQVAAGSPGSPHANQWRAAPTSSAWPPVCRHDCRAPLSLASARWVRSAATTTILPLATSRQHDATTRPPGPRLRPLAGGQSPGHVGWRFSFTRGTGSHFFFPFLRAACAPPQPHEAHTPCPRLVHLPKGHHPSPISRPIPKPSSFLHNSASDRHLTDRPFF